MFPVTRSEMSFVSVLFKCVGFMILYYNLSYKDRLCKGSSSVLCRSCPGVLQSFGVTCSSTSAHLTFQVKAEVLVTKKPFVYFCLYVFIRSFLSDDRPYHDLYK